MSSVNILRASIEPIAKMLANKDIKVAFSAKTRIPTTDFSKKTPVIKLPMLTDKTPPEILEAIQGTVDHEVAHAIWSESPDKVGIKDRLTHQVANIIEDVRIEREMRRLFKGSAHNLQTTARAIMGKDYLTKLEVFRTLKPQAFRLLGVMICLQASEEVPFYQELVKTVPGMQDLYDLITKIWGARPMNPIRSTKDATEFATDVMKRLKIELDDEDPSSSDEDGDGDSSDYDNDDENQGSSEGKGQSKNNKGKGRGRKSKQEEQDDDDESSDNPSDDSGDSSDGRDDKTSSDKKDSQGEGKDSSDGDESDDGEGKDSSGDEESKQNNNEESSGKDSNSGKDGESDDQRKDEENGKGEEDGADGKDQDDPKSCDKDETDGDEDGDDESDSGGDSGEGDGEDSVSERNGDGQDDKGERDGHALEGAAQFEDDPLKPEDLDEITDMTQKVIEGLIDKAQANDTYRILTTDNDKIEHIAPSSKTSQVDRLNNQVKSMTSTIQKNLERAVAARSIVCWTPGHRRGKLFAPALVKLFTGDERVFRRKEEAMSKDVAVSLVVDCSGSMAMDGKAPLAATASYALCEVLTRMGIKNEVIGFTTQGFERHWNDYENNGEYSRVEEVYMPIFKSFVDKFDMTARLRMVKMFEDHWMSNNIDGESVQYAAQRLLAQNTKGKIMIVLSDGYPNALGNDEDLRNDLKETVLNLSKKINIVGIGIRSDAVKDYYPKHVVLNDINELPSTVVKELAKLLLTSK